MNNKYERLMLKNQLCFPLYLCSKELIRKYSPYLQKINLTFAQYIVMMYFWENKSSNVKTLGKTLMLDSSTLTPVLKKIESKGYIKRERNLEDERNLTLTLTEVGENLRDSALKIPDEVGKCVNLSHEEALTLYTLIYKVLNNVIKEE